MNAQVINLAAFRDARRAAEETETREAAKAERIAKEKAAIADDLGGSIGAAIVADVLVDAQERDKEAERAGKYMPAYCDPENETRGAKHDATRGLDIKKIAKRMRADIKQAQRDGLLPKELRASVRIARFSGGQSIDLKVTALPDEWNILSEACASWRKQFPAKPWDCPGEKQDARHKAMMAQLEAIHGAYNRDNSDSMVDYFCVRYYGHAELSWELRDAIESRQVEAARDDYWAESAR